MNFRRSHLKVKPQAPPEGADLTRSRTRFRVTCSQLRSRRVCLPSLVCHISIIVAPLAPKPSCSLFALAESDFKIQPTATKLSPHNYTVFPQLFCCFARCCFALTLTSTRFNSSFNYYLNITHHQPASLSSKKITKQFSFPPSVLSSPPARSRSPSSEAVTSHL